MSEAKIPEVPLTEESPEVKNIFGSDTQIQENTDGFYVVTRLVDGIAKTENRKLHLQLSKSEHIQKGPKTWITALEVEKVSIEDFDITPYFNTIYLETRPEKDDEEHASHIIPELDLASRKTGHLLLDDNIESAGTQSITNPIEKTQYTTLTTLKTADNLLSLFHEQGHHNISRFLSQYDNLTKPEFDELDLIWFLPPTDEVRAMELWKIIIEEEVTANTNALALIKQISKKQNIFSESFEESMPSIKKSMETKLLTYLSMKDGYYLDRITSKELTTILEPKPIDRFKSFIKLLKD